MSKLHEVLAVDGGLKSTADKVLQEAYSTFINKKGHFLGQHRSYQVIEDGTLDYAPEEKSLETTVADKLNYVCDHFVRSLDATLQKEKTNTEARADIIIDGETIAKDMPATYLLNLESRFKELRNMYEGIPTLDPGKNWKKDDTQEDVYVSSDTEQYKTEKIVKPLMLAPATDKHPAQVDKITMDKTVGKWTTKNWSGAITPIDKSKLLSNIDKLLRSIKQARMRANSQEVINENIGMTLMGFVNKI